MFPRRWLPLALLYAFWVTGAVLTIVEAARHPYDPSLVGAARVGRAHPGELATVLTISAAEIVVLTFILRPRSGGRSWRRAVTALILLAPWTGLWAWLAVGGGPATGMHASLLLVLCLGLAFAAAVSGMAARRARGAMRGGTGTA